MEKGGSAPPTPGLGTGLASVPVVGPPSFKQLHATLKLFPVVTRINRSLLVRMYPTIDYLLYAFPLEKRKENKKLSTSYITHPNLQETRLTRHFSLVRLLLDWLGTYLSRKQRDPHRSILPKTALIRSLSPGIGC